MEKYKPKHTNSRQHCPSEQERGKVIKPRPAPPKLATIKALVVAIVGGEVKMPVHNIEQSLTDFADFPGSLGFVHWCIRPTWVKK